MQEQNRDSTFGRNLEAQVTHVLPDWQEHLESSAPDHATSGRHLSYRARHPGSRQLHRRRPGRDGHAVDERSRHWRPSEHGHAGRAPNATRRRGTVMQTQQGPEFCCATQVGGTAANVNTVDQSNVQQSDPGGAQNTFKKASAARPEGAIAQSARRTPTTAERLHRVVRHDGLLRERRRGQLLLRRRLTPDPNSL